MYIYLVFFLQNILLCKYRTVCSDIRILRSDFTAVKLEVQGFRKKEARFSKIKNIPYQLKEEGIKM